MENMILESKIVVRFVENPKVYESNRIVVQFSGTKETLYGGVAQLGEHLPCKQGVMGSNPIISTIFQDRAFGSGLKNRVDDGQSKPISQAQA